MAFLIGAWILSRPASTVGDATREATTTTTPAPSAATLPAPQAAPDIATSRSEGTLQAAPTTVAPAIAAKPAPNGPAPGTPQTRTADRPATGAAPASKVSSSPRAQCGKRSGYALYECMQTQCAKRSFAKHPECQRLRKTQRLE